MKWYIHTGKAYPIKISATLSELFDKCSFPSKSQALFQDDMWVVLLYPQSSSPVGITNTTRVI